SDSLRRGTARRTVAFAPRPSRTVPLESIGEALPGTDPGPVAVSANALAHERIGLGAISELPFVVATPGPQAAVCLHRQAVVFTRGDRDPITVGPDSERGWRSFQIAVAQHAKSVVTPAPQAPVRL